MANNSVVTPYHVLQASFATGEISREVANRVDLDKYQFALTKAKNVLIRPYGPVYKRPGSIYVTSTKYNNTKSILVSFAGSTDTDYLLEIGAGYIRVYKNGVQLADVSTTFTEAMLPNLRVTQSADVMFIASGDQPLKTLTRYSETNWVFAEYEITEPYFDDSLGDGSADATIQPLSTEGVVVLQANEDLFTENMVGSYVRLKQDVASATVSASLNSGSSTGTDIKGSYTSSNINLAISANLVITGNWQGTVYLEKSENGGAWTIVGTYTNNVETTISSFGGGALPSVRLRAEITTGTSLNVRASVMYMGAGMRMYSDVISITGVASSASGYWASNPIYCGESWKIITHGTWAGTVMVQSSDDNVYWRDYRTYTGNSDYNVTESGSLSEGKYVRIQARITSGTCTVDLTALSYNKTGKAKITTFTDSRSVQAEVLVPFGTTLPTKQWAFSAWGDKYGYPKTVAFFQDRLCLGGSKKQPYMLWMSRTGDYNNFSVDKADGKVTDDSAVALPFVSRKQFDIRHLVPNTDLLILTKGNEWIISGNETITPSSATPKMQTTRGCGNVEPIMIGSKTVFVQGRGSVVRDMGYSYETDSYGGADLTLLDKQIVEGVDIVDATYMQEPNSAIYFVRDDGVIAVLSYVIDQKIYAWCTIETDGEFESVCAVAEGDTDTIYVVVKRGDKRYLEVFQGEVHTDIPNDYVMLDSAKAVKSETKSRTFVAEHLANKTVTVLGDGRQFENINVAEDGTLTLPTEVKEAVIGIPYTMEIELPNIEMKIGDGTMQGRYKIVPEVILRLYNTLGGAVGPDANVLDRISYDQYQAIENIALYSGDKKMQVPVGGFNTDGRITVKSNDAYPFNLLAMVREVSFGG